MTLPLGRPGIGHRKLDGADFRRAADALDRAADEGQSRNAARADARGQVDALAVGLAAVWTGPDATTTQRALTDWCTGGGARVETPVAAAYLSLRDLAVVARATAEVIDRVERYERSWLEQAGQRLNEVGVRGSLNALDVLGLVSDDDAQRDRERLDEYHRIADQASAERSAALDRWLAALEASATAVTAAGAALRENTVDPPEALRPRDAPVAATVPLLRLASHGARQSDIADIRRRLAGLSGPQLDAVLRSLSDDELRALHDQLGESWVKGGLSADETRDFINLIAAHASLDTLRRLGRAGWAELAPDPRTALADSANPSPATRQYFDGLAYRPWAGPLVANGYTAGDVDQGAVGDCYLIAAMQALAMRDPAALERMIRANPNGTYTVTFADGTQEVVTPDLAVDAGGTPAFAHPGPGSGGDLWPLLIEKAYAQRHGGWGAITGGYTDKAVEELSGRPADRIPPRSVSIADLADRLDRGEILGVGTIHAPDESEAGMANWLAHDAPEPFRRPKGSEMVPQHAFTITRVDRVAGTVTLVNPWHPTRGEVVLTESELKECINTVFVNEAR